MYLLSGSFAYDTILMHDGAFEDRIMPTAVKNLNVAFGIKSVQNEFGGCGGNIAYNAALLGQAPLLCSSVGGQDFLSYENHLKNLGVNTSNLTQIENEATAHAWILTDAKNNQLTSFSQGAMRHKPRLSGDTPDIWHLAPDNIANTAWLAKKAISLGKNYLFDPGQCLAPFLEGSSEDIMPFKEILKNSTGLFLNGYETQMLENALSINVRSLISENTKFIVQTLGSQGLYLHTKDETITIGVAKPDKIMDATGCGDALRAGFLYGLTKGWKLEECAKLGSVMGSFAVECSGGQNHKPSIDAIFNRLQANFSAAKKNSPKGF